LEKAENPVEGIVRFLDGKANKALMAFGDSTTDILNYTRRSTGRECSRLGVA
jgi:hypothetical protein